jgi:hypothetical protein
MDIAAGVFLGLLGFSALPLIAWFLWAVFTLRI